MGRDGICVTLYNNFNKILLERIEKQTKINFEKVGPPQPMDIMAASCRDSVKNLDKIYHNLNEEIMSIFRNFTEEIVTE